MNTLTDITEVHLPADEATLLRMVYALMFDAPAMPSEMRYYLIAAVSFSRPVFLTPVEILALSGALCNARLNGAEGLSDAIRALNTAYAALTDAECPRVSC